MTLHSMEIPDGTGFNIRNDIIAALKALASNSTGIYANFPAQFPNQFFCDTASGYILKINNAGDNLDVIEMIDRRLLSSAMGTSAYKITPDPALDRYWSGMIYKFIADVTCGDSPTFAISSLVAKNINRYSNGSLIACGASSIVANQIALVLYNLTLDCFVLLNPAN